jgi:hypothetical protein
MKKYNRIESYTEALFLLGKKDKIRIAANTLLIKDNDVVYIRLYSTDIVTYYKNGTYSFSTGGWDTRLTRKRIDTYGPSRYVYAKME